MQRRPRHAYLLRRAEGLENVFAKLGGDGPLADDTETSGLVWHQDRVGAINLAANDTAIMAIEDALGPTARFLADQIKRRRELVFHHGKFDMHMQRESFGLHVPYPVHDTRISSFLLDNRGAPLDHYPYSAGHSLKPLATALLDPRAMDFETELLKAIAKRGGGRGKDAKKNWAILLNTEDEHLVTKYGPMDAWYTLQLHIDFMKRIAGWMQPDGDYPPLMDIYRTEQWVLLALRDMEETGIKVKPALLEKWMRAMKKEKDKAFDELWKLAGKRDINWNSPQQVRQLLFGSRREGGLGLESTRMTKGSRKNPEKMPEASTDKITLILLNHPIGGALLRYRKADGRYGEAESILRFMRTDTHTVHPTFNQNVDTGRMSCTEPNLQNREREGEMRSAFLASRSVDYKQIELRIAACVAQERALLEAFRSGQDPHMATAMAMFGLDESDITPEQRTHGKTLNFAGIYGAGAPGIAEQMMAKMSAKEAYAACKKLGYRPSYSESPWLALGRLLSDRHRRMMPSIGRAAKREEHYARRRGYAMNLMGRHRFFRPDEDEHVAFNTNVQGTAADIQKRGMAKVYRELQLGTGELKLQLQVHDEIVYTSSGDPRTDRRVLKLLAEPDRFDLPIIADVKDITKSWKDKKEVKL